MQLYGALEDFDRHRAGGIDQHLKPRAPDACRGGLAMDVEACPRDKMLHVHQCATDLLAERDVVHAAVFGEMRRVQRDRRVLGEACQGAVGQGDRRQPSRVSGHRVPGRHDGAGVCRLGLAAAVRDRREWLVDREHSRGVDLGLGRDVQPDEGAGDDKDQDGQDDQETSPAAAWFGRGLQFGASHGARER